ncbi:MAG: MBL fold metallo-hydrolase [Clostridia bacterium]|nr:MBL fold metallo-hydrolase [Clostridia bacterium]
MKVYKIPPQGFASNSYILTADGKNAVIIDCAQPRVFSICREKGLTPRAVLLTHGHFDHVCGCAKFYEEGVKIYCGENEKDFIFCDDNKSLFGVNIPYFDIYKTLSDGEEVEIAGIKIKTVFTPGHTAGGVCYIVEGCLFSGDTLFCESVGRTDLPTGNASEIIKSVKKLFALKGNYKVYCGHDSDTTLEHERNFNPYVKY